MARTGGFSFFERNLAAYALGARVIASSNQKAANYTIGKDRAFAWKSIGSSDGTNETLVITFENSVVISRLFILSHNFKTFSIQYNGAQDFSNVVGLNGALAGGLSESDYELQTSYYEFDAVSVDSLTISVTHTHDGSAEKILAQILATTEIGTLKGYPKINGVTFDRNETSQANAAGGQRIYKKRKTAKITVDFEHYPYQQDIDLLSGLFDREEAFLVWPNGGKPEQFRLTLQGYRLEDVFLMQTVGTFKSNFYKNIYSLSGEGKLTLEEVDQ